MAGIAFAVSAASLILLAFLLQDLEWKPLRQTGLLYLGIILLMSALSTALYTLEVYILLRAGGFRVSIWQVYLVLTASMSANYVTPVKVGIPLRIYLYHHFIQVPISVGTALVAIETLIGMIVPAILAIVGIITLFPHVSLSVPIVLLVVLLSAAGAILLIKPARVEHLFSRFLPTRFPRRITQFIINVQIGLRSVPKWALASIVVVLLLSFVVTSARLYFILRMLGYVIDPVKVFYTRVISVTAGSASMIPMGLGVRDASVAFLLVALGISSKVALSATVIERLFSPGWPLLLGLISTNVLGVSELMKQSDNPTAKQG
jgi:uncharacterized protein (TIRG00374 family)